MGLVNLLSMEEDGTASMDYDLQLYGAADEIVPLLMKGELDMAAIPANLAATLYQKTEGGIQAVAVNTLGVLYVVEKGKHRPQLFRPEGPHHPVHRQGHHAGVRAALPADQERHRPGQGCEDRILQRGFRGDRPDGCHQEGRHRCSAPALCDGRSDEGQRPACGAGPDEGVEQGL